MLSVNRNMPSIPYIANDYDQLKIDFYTTDKSIIVNKQRYIHQFIVYQLIETCYQFII